MTIWKYPLAQVGCQAVRMAAGAEILHIGLDPDKIICLWALVDNEIKPVRRVDDEIRMIRMVGTGQPIDARDKSSYIGTVRSGRFMWHFFEEKD